MSQTASQSRAPVSSWLDDFRSSWKTLFLTDIVFKLIAFIALTPLVSLLFRVLLSTSGNAVLSDVDIVKYFLGPAGWLCAIVVGAAWLGVAALELAALMGIVCASRSGKRLPVFGALRFAASHTWPVVRLTARIVGITLLAAAPFVAAAGAVYVTLLTEYDINYYLTERPPAFKIALGIGAAIFVAMAAVALRLLSSWAFALPLVLFEGVAPSDALKTSRERAAGQTGRLLFWILAWLAGTMALSALATGTVGLVGRSLVPHATGSLQLLSTAIGIVMLVWGVIHLVVNLLSTTAGAAICFSLYDRWGASDGASQPTLGHADRKTRLLLTPGRLAALAAAGVPLAAVIGAFAVGSVQLQDDVQVMAHRGASIEAPENTLASIKRAIEVGADFVEIDVQETADGRVVVFHDSDFMKLANNKLKVWEATLSDLKEIDIGSWFAPEFAGERVPTLAQVLDECKGRIKVNIELKYYGHDDQLEQRVVDIVESRGMGEDVVVMSLNAGQVKKMRSLRPDWKVGQVMSVSAGNLKRMEADFLAVNASFVHRRLVRRAHRSQMEVYVWTVNDAASISTMISRGVDALLTDEAALALSVIEQRAQMSAPQRLLLEFAGIMGVPVKLGEQ